MEFDRARAAALLVLRPRLQQADLIYSLSNGLSICQPRPRDGCSQDVTVAALLRFVRGCQKALAAAPQALAAGQGSNISTVVVSSSGQIRALAQEPIARLHGGLEGLLTHKDSTAVQSAEASQLLLLLHQLLPFNSYTPHTTCYSPLLLSGHLPFKHGEGVPLAMLPAATLKMTLA